MRKRLILLSSVLLLSVSLFGCINGGNGTQLQNEAPQKEEEQKPAEHKNETVEYRDTKYSFTFSLPLSWTGYSIVDGKWEGSPVESSKVTETGPLLSIRHPQWTTQDQRQDIPIMIFTIKQWDSLQQGEYHIGAAPIGPRELGRNSKYVFALPARYNFAFPTGFEEVEEILEGNPLQAKINA